MPGQTIGMAMNYGYAGNYARQPDMIVDAHPLGENSNITFGTALVYDGNSVVPFGSTHTAGNFVGIAAREIKSALNYIDQNAGQYQPNDAVSVFKRGSINVICNVGTPTLGGKVYIRTKSNASIPIGVVGGFEAQADAANTIELTNCQWHGNADANKVAELTILTRNRA